jgi:hypothetical protein
MVDIALSGTVTAIELGSVGTPLAHIVERGIACSGYEMMCDELAMVFILANGPPGIELNGGLPYII